MASVERVTLYSPPSQDDVTAKEAPMPKAHGIWRERDSPVAPALGGAWIAEDVFDEHELHVRISLDTQQRWLFAARVEKGQRGQGVYSALLDVILQSDANVWAAINPSNVASMRAHKSFVVETAGVFCVLRVGPFAWGRVANAGGSVPAKSAEPAFSDHRSHVLKLQDCCTTNGKEKPLVICITSGQ
ncbi:hypothetical protein [Rhodopirellula halodulae]|uniref:hypothetical protein n=1 Tax=Rhodopirellula halodulae TaxID=2894198 RepID=UPI001E56F105|nr:hypothetical protein [Rhodopirellula sp. JC737]